MSANEKDLEIEDDLAKGNSVAVMLALTHFLTFYSSENSPRLEVEDFVPIEEKLCTREGC